MSMLETVQRFAKRTNINVPTTVLGSTDPQIKQVMALLEEEGNDLSGRGDWEVLTNEATLTTVATESQGAIGDIATNGFRWIKNDTIWDRSRLLPVYVINGPEWQEVKATAATGPNYQARLRGGNLISNPVPTAGNTWAFEYVSWNWITDSAGANPAQYFTSDDDLMLLPEPILMMGLRWRWKKEKGFEYAEDFRTYEKMVADAFSREGLNRPISMSRRSDSPRPRACVPDYSWNL